MTYRIIAISVQPKCARLKDYEHANSFDLLVGRHLWLYWHKQVYYRMFTYNYYDIIIHCNGNFYLFFI